MQICILHQIQPPSIRIFYDIRQETGSDTVLQSCNKLFPISLMIFGADEIVEQDLNI